MIRKYQCEHGLEKCFDCLEKHHIEETDALAESLRIAQAQRDFYESHDELEKTSNKRLLAENQDLQKEVERWKSYVLQNEDHWKLKAEKLGYEIDYLNRQLANWKRHVADGYCPECIYSFNGVCDELCDNEFCPEHLRQRLIDADIFSFKRGDKMYGDK